MKLFVVLFASLLTTAAGDEGGAAESINPLVAMDRIVEETLVKSLKNEESALASGAGHLEVFTAGSPEGHEATAEERKNMVRALEAADQMMERMSHILPSEFVGTVEIVEKGSDGELHAHEASPEEAEQATAFMAQQEKMMETEFAHHG